MQECPSIQTCPFFNDKMANMPGTTAVLKRNHCKDKYSDCARFLVSKVLGKEKVPPDLFPTQTNRARQLIDSAK